MNSTDKNQIEILKKSVEQILASVKEIENNKNIDFHRSLIQMKSIEIYNCSQSISESISTEEISESPVRMKQEETEVVVLNEAIPATVQESGTEISIPEPEREIIEEVKVAEQVITPEPVIEKEPERVAPPEPIATPVVEPKTVNAPIPPVTEIKTVVPPASEKKPVQKPETPEHESLNDRLSKNKQPAVNLIEKSKETPIKDITKAISIGKKFEFINALFDGNSEAYKACLQRVQNSENIQEAYEFLENEIVNTYHWEENEKLAEEFFSLTRRRFL